MVGQEKGGASLHGQRAHSAKNSPPCIPLPPFLALTGRLPPRPRRWPAAPRRARQRPPRGGAAWSQACVFTNSRRLEKDTADGGVLDWRLARTRTPTADPKRRKKPRPMRHSFFRSTELRADALVSRFCPSVHPSSLSSAPWLTTCCPTSGRTTSWTRRAKK